MKTTVQASPGGGIMVRHASMKIALDPSRETEADVVFVSHAHMDHVHRPADGEIVLSSRETAEIARERGYEFGNQKEEAGGFELVDSGHILGSRALLMEGGVYYTGDIAGRERAFLTGCKARKCDTLIIESTYGSPEFRFPSVRDVLSQTNRLIGDYFSQGIPVVLMGYSLGKAQILTHLFNAWDPMYVQQSVARLNMVYSKLGAPLRSDHPSLPEAEGRLSRRPWVLISPPYSARSSFVRSLKKRFGAVTVGFTGWCVKEGYRQRMGFDHCLPLSDHCDFSELISMVKKCSPEKVYTFHGYAAEFAGHLRRMGFDAQPVSPSQASLHDYLD